MSRKSSSPIDRLATPRARSVALISLIVATFLLGGGSRADITSLILLRPVAFGFLAYAVLVAPRGAFAAVRIPAALLAALAAIIALQLVPLPPAVWSSLPGRDLYRETFAAAGISAPWLPLALVPFRAINALMALTVPVAAMLLTAQQDRAGRERALQTICAMAAISMLLGVIQLLGSPNGPAYLYRITNNGLPVGLFSNRNHQALLMAIGIMLSASLIAGELRRRRLRALPITIYVAAIVLFVPFLLVIGSRAGLLLGIAMFLPAGWVVYRALNGRLAPSGRTILSDRRYRMISIAVVIVVVAVTLAAVFLARSLAFDRLMDKDIATDMRAEALPTILHMIPASLPWGQGFGAFEAAFLRAEPDSFLGPSYLNHAHDDWIEVIIDGGIAAIAVLAVFIAWFVKVAFSALRRSAFASGHTLFCGVGVIAFAASSLVDYPLRVPSLMLVFAVLVATLASEEREGNGVA